MNKNRIITGPRYKRTVLSINEITTCQFFGGISCHSRKEFENFQQEFVMI